MPEGPSIVILKEQMQQFAGKKILSVSGNSNIDKTRLDNSTVEFINSWGKHFLICFGDVTFRYSGDIQEKGTGEVSFVMAARNYIYDII